MEISGLFGYFVEACMAVRLGWYTV